MDSLLANSSPQKIINCHNLLTLRFSFLLKLQIDFVCINACFGMFSYVLRKPIKASFKKKKNYNSLKIFTFY